MNAGEFKKTGQKLEQHLRKNFLQSTNIIVYNII